MDELADLYGDDAPVTTTRDGTDDAPMADRSHPPGDEMDETGNDQGEDNDDDHDDDDEDDDSDLEIVISAKPGQRVEAPVAAKQNGLAAAVKITKPTGVQGAISIVQPKREPVVRPPEIELDAIALLDGKSIVEQNLEELEPKPWRAPGADISEYFNYGFDEFTWTAYCQKQRSLRDDYEPGKVMASMMPDPMMGMMPMPGMNMNMNMGMGMPGMMPGMDPQQMAMMMGGMGGQPDDRNSPAPSYGGSQSQQPQQQQQQQQQQQAPPRGPTGNGGNRSRRRW